jgi:hypothetical protein
LVYQVNICFIFQCIKSYVILDFPLTANKKLKEMNNPENLLLMIS